MNEKAIFLIIKNSIQNALLFKGSFLIKILTIFLTELSSIVVMLVLLSTFQGYEDYTSGQFLFLYFFAHISYSICMLVFNNLRTMGIFVQSGSLDQILLMPLNTMAYVCCYNFNLTSIGQVGTSILLFLFFADSFGIEWKISTILFTLVMLICSILVLASILIVLSSAAYFIIDWKPMENMFSAFREMLWYPVTIYNKIVQAILYTFVPIAYIVYVPSNLIFNVHSSIWKMLVVSCIFLTASILLFIVCYKIWFYQSRKYQSVS